MTNANFTKTVNGISVSDEPLPVYEIRVEKGCGKKSEFLENVNKGIQEITICIQSIILIKSNHDLCH